MTPLRFGPYRDLAAAVAERLLASGGSEVAPASSRPSAVEVLVASSGVAEAIAAEVLRRVTSGVAALRLQTEIGRAHV